jgi:hypothetical protein
MDYGRSYNVIRVITKKFGRFNKESSHECREKRRLGRDETKVGLHGVKKRN